MTEEKSKWPLRRITALIGAAGFFGSLWAPWGAVQFFTAYPSEARGYMLPGGWVASFFMVLVVITALMYNQIRHPNRFLKVLVALSFLASMVNIVGIRFFPGGSFRWGAGLVLLTHAIAWIDFDKLFHRRKVGAEPTRTVASKGNGPA